MKLFTKSQLSKLVENHNQQDGSKSFKAVVKLFNPTGQGTWYLSEYDPKTDVAFGLCKIFEKECVKLTAYIDLGLIKETEYLFDILKNCVSILNISISAPAQAHFLILPENQD